MISMPFKKTIVWYLILLPFSYFCFKIHSLYLSSSPVIAYLIGACPLILFIYLPLKNNYQKFFQAEFQNRLLFSCCLGLLLGLVLGFLSRLFLQETYGLFPNNYLFGFFYWLFISFAQETFFRAYLLKSLLKNFSLPKSLLISSLLFALWHLTVPFSPLWLTFSGLLKVFCLGLVLGYFYLKTKNLATPIIIHTAIGLFLSQF